MTPLLRSMRKEPAARIAFRGMPIHTKYVLNRLKDTRWEDRRIILNLIEIEQRILDRHEGRPDTGDRDALMKQYPEETRAIEAELLSPAHFDLRRRRKDPTEKQMEELRRRRESERLLTEEQERQEWITIGGKP